MYRVFVILLWVLASCSEPSLTQQIKAHAAGSGVVFLCDVDSTGSKVRYKLKQSLKPNAGSSQLAPGQFLTLSGPAITPGTGYGDEALIFYKKTSTASPDLILILHDGKAEDGTTRDELLRLIQEAQTK